MPRKGQEDGTSTQDQTSNWKIDDSTRNDLDTKNTLQQPATPIMPKKVSFAAEVDEQQERINKENMRRDACCVIQ